MEILPEEPVQDGGELGAGDSGFGVRAVGDALGLCPFAARGIPQGMTNVPPST